MKKIALLIISILVFSCSPSLEKARLNEWQGTWTAQWELLPESYPGIENMMFSMNGSFIFENDSLTVEANGFEGCIFNSDTLSHTQFWHVSNDTLFLMNNSDLPGIIYIVKSQSKNKIELQLVEDIFVTLTK